MLESTEQTDTFIETKLEAGDLIPEVIAGLDDKAKADLVSYFIAKSTAVREGINVETVKNPTRTSAELKSQIKLFRSLESISGFLSRLTGERSYSAMLHMYQARREDLENRLYNIENPSSETSEPTGLSVCEEIRSRMPHQYVAPTHEATEAQAA